MNMIPLVMANEPGKAQLVNPEPPGSRIVAFRMKLDKATR